MAVLQHKDTEQWQDTYDDTSFLFYTFFYFSKPAAYITHKWLMQQKSPGNLKTEGLKLNMSLSSYSQYIQHESISTRLFSISPVVSQL